MVKNHLKRELRRLYDSLDFFSRNFLNGKGKKKKAIKRYFNIYQQLGLAWEFLGLQCKHWDGYKTTTDKRKVCKICGKVKNATENYYLLPREGVKKIGLRALPNSKKVFPTKEKAKILNDTLNFHGALLNVDVSNSYKSSFLGKKHDMNIAADRIVTLEERGMHCRLDQHLIHIKVDERKKGNRVYGDFPWEIRRKHLKNCPVLFEFDRNYRFLGLTIFR